MMKQHDGPKREVRRVLFEQPGTPSVRNNSAPPDDSVTLPPQPGVATQRSAPAPQSTSGGRRQAAPTSNCELGTFEEQLLKCGGRIVRFLGSEEDFQERAATVPTPDTSRGYRGPQVHFLEPIDFMDSQTENVVSAFLARVEHFLAPGGYGDLAWLGGHVPAVLQEVRQLGITNVISHGVNNPGALDPELYANAQIRSAHCAASLSQMFTKTIERVGSPRVILVQPFLNLEFEPTHIVPTLKSLKNLRADNLVWLPVIPAIPEFREQESMLNRLCSGQIR